MPDEFSITARVAADHPCLAGHFPDRPMVPAVLLLDLVADALREKFGAIRIGTLSSAKFLAPVRPDERITIRIGSAAGSGKARFRCLVGDRLVAQGEFIFTLGDG